MQSQKSEMSGLELQEILAKVGVKYRATRHVPKHLEYLAARLSEFAADDQPEYTDIERERLIMDIVDKVSEITNVPVQKLLHYRRQYQRISLMRQVAMYLAREQTRASFPMIGKIFGRDHSTVIHAYRRIAEMVKQPGHARTMVAMVRDALERKEQAA